MQPPSCNATSCTLQATRCSLQVARYAVTCNLQPARRNSQKQKLPDINVAASPEWKIFTLPSVIALIFWQFGSNFLFAVLQMLGPTYYTTTLNCSSERTGILLALAQLANFPASFLGMPDKHYAVAVVRAHYQFLSSLLIRVSGG